MEHRGHVGATRLKLDHYPTVSMIVGLNITTLKPEALGPVANTNTKLLIYGLFQKGRVLAQDEVQSCQSLLVHPLRQIRLRGRDPSYHR